MESSQKLDVITRLALLLVMFLISLRTLSLEKAYRLRERFIHLIWTLESDLARSNEFRSCSNESTSLSQQHLMSIVNAVRWRNYSQAKARLIKLGFRNPKISKRGDLILIYHDQGKLIIDSRDLRILG